MDRGHKVLKTVWGSVIPTAIVIFMVFIVLTLFGLVKKKGADLKAKKAAEIQNLRPAVNVVVLEVEYETVKDRINLPGMVEADKVIEMAPEVGGTVIELNCKEGDRVKKDDIILKIDSKDYLNMLKYNAASFELAKVTYERTKKLGDMELVSKNTLDTAESQFKSSQAMMELTKAYLARCEVRAPFSGIINKVNVKIGSTVSSLAPAPIIELINIDRVKFSVGIPEMDVDSVRKLNSFEVSVDALKGKKFTARKRYLASAPDNMAHLYKLELEVDNPGHELLPGMFARVDIVKEKFNKAISIPLYAVVSRGNDRIAFVEKDGKVSSRHVETGVLEGWKMQITEGLNEGDHVVVVGQRSIDDGQDVKVVKTVKNLEELYK